MRDRKEVEKTGQISHLKFTHKKETKMTRKDLSTINYAVQEILENGLDGLENAFSLLLNEVMRIERSKTLNTELYERSGDRKGYANGFKSKKLKSRVGTLNLQIPQVIGDVSFYPSSLEKGIRSERALKLAIAEMYIQGVSTRKVSEVFEKMCGLEVSSSDVSRATGLLDVELKQWRNRPLGKTRFLQLDARYEKVRMAGSVVSVAVLIAVGVNEEGKRSVLGVSAKLSEAEVHWREFLISLKKRGLHGVEYVVSDDHEGLKKALTTTLGSASWNRCHVHMQRNAVSYVPKVAMKSEVANDIGAVLTAPDLETAKYLLQKHLKKYEKTATKLAVWMEDNVPEGFAVFKLEKKFRKKLRSTNMLERLNREIKRRTSLRLVSAVLMEKSEELESGRRYISSDD